MQERSVVWEAVVAADHVTSTDGGGLVSGVGVFKLKRSRINLVSFEKLLGWIFLLAHRLQPPEDLGHENWTA